MKYSIQDLLFKHTGAIRTVNEHMNSSVVTMSTTCAVKRKASYKIAKINYAAKLFDWIYENRLSVYRNAVKDGYEYIIDVKDKAIFYVTDNFIRYASRSATMHPTHSVVAYALYDTFENPLKMEAEIIDERIKMLKNVDKESAAIFSENFYYSLLPYNRLEELDISEVDQEEIFRYMSTNNFTRVEECQGIEFSGNALDSHIKKTTAKRPKTSKKKETSFLDELKAGKYRINYAWDSRIANKVIKPEFLDTFEITEEFKEIVKKIKFHSDRILERMDMGCVGAEAIGKDAMNILIVGKPGTGKTTLCYALSAATGIPVCSTAWSKHSDEDEVEGKTKIVNGKPEFVETDSLLFHQFGGININEEINLADPSVTMGVYGQQLEYPYIVKRNGYETIVRHPLNIQIAAMNVGTNGSLPLNQALANRFKTTFILDDPTKETFINILIKSSGKDKDICEYVQNAYERIVNYLMSPSVNEEELVNNLSIRTCLGAITNMEEGQPPKRALINSLVGAIAVVDLELARKIQNEIIDLLPEPKFTF